LWWDLQEGLDRMKRCSRIGGLVERLTVFLVLFPYRRIEVEEGM
jgi:hypothetical protein